MSSSIQKSNARLVIYAAPVAIGFIFALATGGVVNLPFIAILSTIHAFLGKEGFTFLKETLTLLGSGGVNLLTGEAHERFKDFLKGFQTEKLLSEAKFQETIKKTIIYILDEEKEKSEFSGQKKNLEKLVKAVREYYEKTIELKPEEINDDIRQSILKSFIFEAKDLTSNSSPLDKSEWKNLLADTAIITDESAYVEGIGFRLGIPADFRNSLDKLAESLEKNFPKRFQNFLEKDFSEDGETFAKFVLDFLKKIDDSGDEIKNILAGFKIDIETLKQNTSLALQQGRINQAEILEFLNKVSKQIGNLQTALSANNNNISPNEIYETNKNLESGFKEFGGQITLVISLQRQLPSQIADELEKRKLISKNDLPQGLINISEDGNAFFTEQGNVLPDLETQLKNKHIACLHGKHGLGKTTNAREFARRQKENYGFIVFLQSAEQIIENSIVDFADRYVPELQSLPLFEREQVRRDTKLKLFKDFFDGEQFQTGEKRAWLLIFDNLDRLEHIEKYFPNRRNGDILYTCNDDLWLKERCEVPIGEFSREEAELFLYKTSDARKDARREDIPAETLAGIRKILDGYGRLPFVLSKFRNYLSEIRISHTQFYDELKNNERRYLEAFDAHGGYQFKNEIVAFSVSFEKIATPDDESEHAKIVSRLAEALLNISAFCFADRIPEEILKETLFRLADMPETTASKDVLFREAFRKLERFDLLNDKIEIFDYLEKKEITDDAGNKNIIYEPYQKEETVYISHRTIQKILKVKLEHENQRKILTETINILSDFIPWCYLETWKVYEKYFSNAESLIEEAKTLNLATEGLGFISNQFGCYQWELAQFERAVQFYQEALQIDENTVGKEHPEHTVRLNNLALIYYSQGRFKEAIELYRQALLLAEKNIGKEHPNYAICLGNIAKIYCQQEDFISAELNNLQALKIFEKAVGKEHPYYAICIHDLAFVYKSQGKYEKAIELYEQAMQIDEKTIGKEHPEYAARLANLANIYEWKEEFMEALKSYEQALFITEKTLPENHPYIIQLRESVARCRTKIDK